MVGVLALDHGFGPELRNDLEVLVHDLAALLEWHADGIELALIPAGRHAHDQAAPRQKVHAGKLLCEQDRIA